MLHISLTGFGHLGRESLEQEGRGWMVTIDHFQRNLPLISLTSDSPALDGLHTSRDDTEVIEDNFMNMTLFNISVIRENKDNLDPVVISLTRINKTTRKVCRWII